MKIYPEIKEIADKINEVKILHKKIMKETCLIDCDFYCSEILYGCQEYNGHLYHCGKQLDNSGIVGNQYYCECKYSNGEDFSFGNMFFATDIPGTFVKVPFET